VIAFGIIKKMNLRHIRYFVAVAEELHFGRAAQRLGISQPPLSLQIQALEKDLGTKLFDRTRHKVALTLAGQATLAEAYRLLEHAEYVRTVARQANAHPISRLDIGCVSSVLFDVLPPLLDRLHVKHPEISLSLRDYETTEALHALLNAKLDVAFIRIDKVDPPLKAHRIMDDHFIAALPARHRLARRKTIPLISLANEPLVVYSRRLSPASHDRIIAACLESGFTPNLAYYSATIQSQIGFVACGLGVALVPQLVQRWRIPRVVYRPLEKPISTTAVSMVWNGRTRSESVRLFLEVTQQLYARKR